MIFLSKLITLSLILNFTFLNAQKAEDWENPNVFDINKLPAHASFMPPVPPPTETGNGVILTMMP